MSSVTEPRKEYTDLLPDVVRNRCAVAGERAVKDKGELFLPPLASMCCTTHELENGYQQIRKGNCVSAEGRASYNKYLSLAYFYGASGRTVDGLGGLIFSKDPVTDLDNNIEYLQVNADGKGNSLRKLAQDAVNEAFITPRSGLLVDFPNVQQAVSIADAEANNLRPKILHYPYESIINWHYDVVNNEQKLVLLVLMEASTTVKERFEVTTETQYRVLELIDGVYHQSVYKDNGDEIQQPTPILVNGQPSNEIPFYLVRVGAEQKSVINDLVDANYNHYRFFADYAAKEHASAFPVFYETGVQGNDDNLMIGPGAKWSSASTDAQFGVLQTESDGGSMRQYLLDMEQRMAALGAEMLKPRIAGAESAEAKSLDQVAQNSTVSNIATNVSEAMTKALNFCSRWLGGTEQSVYKLNTDYNPQALNPQALTALLAAWQGGAISYDTFYDNLQRGEIADGNVTAEEEQSKIAREGSGLIGDQ